MRYYATFLLLIGMTVGFVGQSIVSAQQPVGEGPRKAMAPIPPIPPISINSKDGSMTIGPDGTLTVVTDDGEITVGGSTKKKDKAERAREKEERRKADEKKRDEQLKAHEAKIEPTFSVTGGFENSLEKARESALIAAKEKFHDYLSNLDDPIRREPNLDLVRRMILSTRETIQNESIRSATSSSSEMMYRVTYPLKVQEDHIRIMRTRERSSEALGVIGLGALALLVVAGFFKLDAMTKGYVTNWLMLGMVGVGAAVLGVWTYSWGW